MKHKFRIQSNEQGQIIKAELKRAGIKARVGIYKHEPVLLAYFTDPSDAVEVGSILNKYLENGAAV